MASNTVSSNGSDIFLAGKMVFVDPVTKVRREEDTPEINLSQFIRRMKFPAYLLRRPAKGANRRYNVPLTPKQASTPKPKHRNSSQNPNSSVKANLQSQTSDFSDSSAVHASSTSSEDTCAVSPSRDDEMLQRALAASLNDTKKSTDVNHNTAVSKDNRACAVSLSQLQRALAASLNDTKKSTHINHNTAVPKDYLSAMTEDEQLEMALRLSAGAS